MKSCCFTIHLSCKNNAHAVLKKIIIFFIVDIIRMYVLYVCIYLHILIIKY